MRIAETAYPLPDGRVLTIRSAAPKDAASLALHRCITSGETPFMARYPEECTRDAEALAGLQGGVEGLGRKDLGVALVQHAPVGLGEGLHQDHGRLQTPGGLQAPKKPLPPLLQGPGDRLGEGAVHLVGVRQIPAGGPGCRVQHELSEPHGPPPTPGGLPAPSPWEAPPPARTGRRSGAR